MKHTPTTTAALHGHICSVPYYRPAIDCTAQAIQMRVRRRKILWALLFGAMFGMFLAGGMM